MFNLYASNGGNDRGRENFQLVSYDKPPIHSHKYQSHPNPMDGFDNSYKRHGRSVHKSRPNGRAYQSHCTHRVGFSSLYPRSFEELHTERAYLLNNLQREDAKATELLKRIATLQDEVNQDQESRPRRRVQKSLDWLMCRMKETTRQEKSILQRLGQVTHEIQHRERWSRIEEERNIQRFWNGFQPSSQLDPTMSEFTPYENGIPPANMGQGFYRYPQMAVHELAAQIGVCQIVTQGTESECMQPTMVGKGRSNSVTESGKSLHQERRLSMPVLSSSVCDETGNSGPQYMGYYVSN